MNKSFWMALLLLGSGLRPMHAQRYPEFEAQLHRIFDQRMYQAEAPHQFRWMPDGGSYSVTRGVAGGSESEIRVCGIESGQCSETVKSPVAIESYDWSPDGKKLLVFANSFRNWASENAAYARRG